MGKSTLKQADDRGRLVRHTGYDGEVFELVHEASNEVVALGDTLTGVDHRGDAYEYEVTGGMAPHKEGSSGRIYLKDAEGFDHGYFPSVVGCRWNFSRTDRRFA